MIGLISETLQLIESSPLRKSANPLPVTIDQALLGEEPEQLNIIMNNAENPLKVVVLGEVKAGKSTLINALAGDVVSPTNVIEATASIIEIHYSPNPFGKIYFTDRIVEDHPSKIQEILMNNRNDQNFFEKCTKVEIGIPLSNLKNLWLVDTPGLETSTKENAERTKQYLRNADVILWVFNGHHLGQVDIEDALLEIRSFGKPIFVVINRIDEIDGDPERLQQYLDDQIGMFVDLILPISAYEELGIDELKKYIENIDQQAAEVKQHSIDGSVVALLNQDLMKHEEYLRTIQFLENHVMRVEEHISIIQKRILSTLIRKVEIWYDRDFLSSETNTLRGEVNKIPIYSNVQKRSGEINKQIGSILSEQYLTEVIEHQVAEFRAILHEEWEIEIMKMKDELRLQIQDYDLEAEERISFNLSKYPLYSGVNSGLLAGATSGAMIGGAAGASAAVYAAALGPTAASVTLGMAASAFIPPFLIVGGTVGAVNKLLKVRNDKDMLDNNIYQSIREFKSENRTYIIDAITQPFIEHHQIITNNVINQITANLFKGSNPQATQLLKHELQQYILKLQQRL